MNALCEICQLAPVTAKVRPKARPGDWEPRWWLACRSCEEAVYSGRVDPRDAPVSTPVVS